VRFYRDGLGLRISEFIDFDMGGRNPREWPSSIAGRATVRWPSRSSRRRHGGLEIDDDTWQVGTYQAASTWGHRAPAVAAAPVVAEVSATEVA
jgi:hypothetical protein